ncbi:hypothetical protein L7F22_021555 [Adiantum nelumboides]|nr:hypothetical protein [Adiantum nelumboides]
MRLPWWEEGVTAMHFHRTIAASLEHIKCLNGAAFRTLQARAFISTVMISCSVDNMSALIITPEEISRNLSSDYEEILHHCPPDQPLKPLHVHMFKRCRHVWSLPYDGPPQVIKVAFLSQLYQHLKALMFLCIYHRGEHLDVSLLRETSSILMSGFRAHHHRATVGGFRDVYFTHDGAFLIHEMAIGTSIKDMLIRLQGFDQGENVNDINNHPRSFFEFPDSMASLVHDMAHVYPFDQGNHWMCRLIIAHFMVSHDKFVFPVPIAPVTNRSPEQFVDALLTIDDSQREVSEDGAVGFQREKAILSAYLLECISDSLEELINA